MTMFEADRLAQISAPARAPMDEGGWRPSSPRRSRRGGRGRRGLWPRSAGRCRRGRWSPAVDLGADDAGAGGEPALLVVLPVVGQVALGHDAEDPAAGDDRGAVVQPAVAGQGQRRRAARAAGRRTGLDDPTQGPVDAWRACRPAGGGRRWRRTTGRARGTRRGRRPRRGLAGRGRGGSRRCTRGRRRRRPGWRRRPARSRAWRGRGRGGLVSPCSLWTCGAMASSTLPSIQVRTRARLNWSGVVLGLRAMSRR
jgi:hypothetical protein